MEDLVGNYVSGVVTKTGDSPLFVSLLVDDVVDPDGNSVSLSSAFGDSSVLVTTLDESLETMAKQYHRLYTTMLSEVAAPRAWNFPVPQAESHEIIRNYVGPHVSLDPDSSFGRLGERVTLKITEVKHWMEDSRWVALMLEDTNGNARPLQDNHGWVLHMSCAQGQV